MFFYAKKKKILFAIKKNPYQVKAAKRTYMHQQLKPLYRFYQWMFKTVVEMTKGLQRRFLQQLRSRVLIQRKTNTHCKKKTKTKQEMKINTKKETKWK